MELLKNMSNKEKKINHEMVILARESRGFTQKELSKQLSITQGALSRIESGILGMEDSTLNHLSDVLGYPISFFVQRRPIYGLGLTEVFHRKRQSIGIKTMDRVYSLIDIRTNEISKLLKGVEIGELGFPHFDIDDYDGSAAEIARMVRAKWNIPHGPIQSVTYYFEQARGIIIPFDFETNGIDAISHWLPVLPPIFFLNKYIPTDRMRFSLCHEAGHIIMHQKSPTPEIEKEANAFAAEFLMPERDIKPYLTNLSVEKLASLKPYWKVAMSALLKRAVDLDVITERHGRTLWMQLSKAGYKTREPMELDISPEPPTLLKELLKTYIDDMGYDMSELEKMLNLFESEIQNIYLDSDLKAHLVLKEAEGILRKHKPQQ
jgi:Zn-dependent peptidase ImmA (M78 family)/DNA-binding XRE family transcriptional regulator